MIRLLDTILSLLIIATCVGVLFTPVWLMLWWNPWDQLRRSRADGFYRWAMMRGSCIDWEHFPQIEQASIQHADIRDAKIQTFTFSTQGDDHDSPTDLQP